MRHPFTFDKGDIVESLCPYLIHCWLRRVTKEVCCVKWHVGRRLLYYSRFLKLPAYAEE